MTGEERTQGVAMDAVQKSMTAAHYAETGLDMAAVRPGEALRFWSIGEGVLISKKSGRLLEMMYFLCDERPKALRKTFEFQVSSFDSESGAMTLKTRKGGQNGPASGIQRVGPLLNQPSAPAGSRR